MGRLGDGDIGIMPPLVFRLIVDETKTRSIDEDGNAKFVIGGVQLLCGDQEIIDDLEKKLAFYFMLYGKWPCSEPIARMRNGQLSAVDMVLAPEERSPNEQPFEMIGHLSTMISGRFDDHTVKDGKIARLLPEVDPKSLGVSIPENYKGKVLKLWIMQQVPS